MSPAWFRGGSPSSSDYLGVVAQVSDGWRIVVSPRADAYWLQSLGVGPDGRPGWFLPNGRPSNALARWVDRFADRVPGLAQAAAGLPANPADAAPLHVQARQDFLAAHEANKLTSPRYGRVIAQETQVRLIVDRTATWYALQWVPVTAWQLQQDVTWAWLRKDDSADRLRRWLVRAAFDPEHGVKVASGWWVSTDDGRDLILDRVAKLFRGVPEKPSAGSWPDLPAMPPGFRFYGGNLKPRA